MAAFILDVSIIKLLIDRIIVSVFKFELTIPIMPKTSVRVTVINEIKKTIICGMRLCNSEAKTLSTRILVATNTVKK